MPDSWGSGVGAHSVPLGDTLFPEFAIHPTIAPAGCTSVRARPLAGRSAVDCEGLAGYEGRSGAGEKIDHAHDILGQS